MNRLRTTLLTSLAPAVWGTTYIVTTELLPAGHPLFSSLVRALPAGLSAIALARTLPTGAWWWKSAVLGALNIGAFFPLLFLSAYRLPGGVAATLGAVQPLVVVILVVALLRERLSIWRLAWDLVFLVPRTSAFVFSFWAEFFFESTRGLGGFAESGVVDVASNVVIDGLEGLAEALGCWRMVGGEQGRQ